MTESHHAVCSKILKLTKQTKWHARLGTALIGGIVLRVVWALLRPEKAIEEEKKLGVATGN